MPFSGAIRRHRVAIASNLALLIAATGVLVAAVYADGYRKHEAQLNDGGIWVTNSRDGFHGRINKPIGQIDGAIFAELDTQLDVVQHGAAVIGVNVSAGLLSSIDPATVEHPDGETAKIPGSAQVQMAGGTVAVLDPTTGTLWAERVDPVLGLPLVGNLDAEAPPLAEVGADSALAVTEAGDVLVASSEDDTLNRFARLDDGYAGAEKQDIGADVGPGLSLTAVGDTAVVLDGESGAMQVIGGPDADVPAGSVLQTPSADDGSVLVATSDRLLELDLASGAESVVADGVAGRPSAPVRLGACEYGAWSGGLGAVVTRCDGAEPVANQLGTESTDLVFRVNRGEILLNDRATGAVWNIDSDEPTRLDNWDAYKNRVTKNDKNEENEEKDQGDRRPPEAKPDDLGARLGRTTVLHPLDNDTAPEGRLLAIRSVQDIAGSDARVTISPDGQTVQIQLPNDARTTTFEYYIDDGRQDVSAHATVTVTPRNEGVNAPPQLREGFEPTVWTVPSSGTLDVPVLPDWRDKQDGDPLSLESAVATGGERSGAVARTTASGRVRFTAPVKAGVVTVPYSVTDGIGESVEDELKFQVQGLKDRKAYPAVAEPDVVSGEAGKPITIRPLGNDLPGSDPVTPTAAIELAGKVAEVGGAQVRSDLVDGTLTFTSTQPKTYFLDYDAKYGNAPFARGRIRVDVRAPEKPPKQPIAMPDTVTLYGQSATLVDVLANDVDPTGGLLVVQGATADEDNQADVAVVDGRWLRISARQGQLVPNPQLVRYTISNGTRSGIEGEVVVTQRPAPEDNSPVTETDRVVVREGGGVAVPVLDNDFSPAGDELTLVSDVPGENAGQLTVQPPGEQRVPTGQAYVADRVVRYVAPRDLDDAETFTVRYFASNAAGQRTPGTLEIQVIPDERRNEPPEPPVLEGRAVSGDRVLLKVPGSGVDPDGDPVTLTGITSPPQLGRIVRYGANSLQYQAYPGSVGTEEFDYAVTDPQGGQASGTVRVAIVPPGTPQAPLAVPDTVTTEPGRQARVDPLANDHVAAGDQVSIDLLGEPAGVTLASPQGPILIDAPAEAGRNVEAVYTITNGIDRSQSTVTLRTSTPFNNPPVVFDAFGEPESGDTVTVDVLETAYDPDGEPEGLTVTDVFTPDGVASSIDGRSVTVQRGDQPRVIPFRVRDADGGAATASIFVPPADAGAPYVRPDSVIEVDSGATDSFDLSDYVVNPAGGPVQFTLQDRVWTSPPTDLTASVTADSGFDLTAAEQYAGPGAVIFEVTTGTSVDDPEGVRAVLSVPVQVGAETPILRCPDEPIEISQDTSVDLEIASLCHVWTPDPDDLSSISFDTDWETSVEGLSIIEPSGTTIRVAADAAADPGSRATMLVTSGDSDPGRITLQVVKSPPPSLEAIRIADMRSAESRTIDLAPYLRAGVSNPEPTIVELEQLTRLDVDIAEAGDSNITITTGDQVDGRAEFRVVMSDVAGSTGPERQVEGRIAVEILDVPDTPTAPVPGTSVRDQEVVLNWRAPEANGAPVDLYQLRGNGGVTRECGGTSCEVTGLTNGTAYSFEVRARNSVGWSDWSPGSAEVTPDAKPGQVGRIELVNEGDRTLTISWSPPTTETSDIRRYLISYPGGSKVSTRPSITISGLDNNTKYAFSVAAENERFIGPARTSAPYQSIGTPGTPAAPTITDQKTADTGAVTVSWPAVDPNGPTPVRYTVLRNGSALPACTGITATRCDNSGIQYDGTTYNYSVQATNKGGQGKSATGPATPWKAVGEPEAWGAWSVGPTGQNAQATSSFTVPDSNGGQSIVRIYVNGAVAKEISATGGRTEVFGVPSNDGPFGVLLEVCNESGACSRSTTQNVQTYGPLVNGHIMSLEPLVSGTRVAWRITVDSNGNPAGVTITSPKRNQSFTASGVDVHTFTTSYVDLGYSATESVTVTLSDADPARGPARRTATSPRTEDPPPPTVRVSRGAKCNDGGGTPCQGAGGGGIPCTNPSCGRITITTTNFTTQTANCQIYDSSDGQFTSKTVTTNTSDQTSAYFGYPQRQVWAVCNGTESPRYDWPDN